MRDIELMELWLDSISYQRKNIPEFNNKDFEIYCLDFIYELNKQKDKLKELIKNSINTYEIKNRKTKAK